MGGYCGGDMGSGHETPSTYHCQHIIVNITCITLNNIIICIESTCANY